MLRCGVLLWSVVLCWVCPVVYDVIYVGSTIDLEAASVSVIYMISEPFRKSREDSKPGGLT